MMQVTTPLLTTLDAKTIKSLLGKIAKSKGSNAKLTKAFRETVAFDQCASLAHELVRSGQWNLSSEGPGAFELLLSGDGPIDAADARAWIASAAANPGAPQWWPAAPGWPDALDRIVARSYVRDADAASEAAWEALAQSLDGSMRAGLDLSRLRLGATLSSERTHAAVALFAEAMLAGTTMIGCAGSAVEYVDRQGVRRKTTDDIEDNVHALIASFSDEATLASALEAAVARGATCSESTIGPVYARLEAASLGRLLRRSDRHRREAWPSLRALDARPLSYWNTLLDELLPPSAPPFDSGAVMDMVFALAARAALREGSELPARFDALLTLEWPEHSPPFRHVDVMTDALRALPAARAHALIERWIDRPMHMFQPAALLVSVAPTPAWIDRLLARIDEYAARSSDPRALRALALVGVVGQAGLPAFAQAYERAEPNQRLLYAHVILATLAVIGRAGGTFDPAFDRFIDVHQCEAMPNDRASVEMFVADFCAAALQALPPERAEPIVLAAIDRAHDDWTIGWTLVPAVRTEAVIERAASMLRARAAELGPEDRLVRRAFSQLDRRTTAALLRATLSAGESAAIVAALRPYVPADLLSAEQGSGSAPLDRTEALAAQARALSAKLPGPTRAQYVLGWLDAPAGAGDVSRSGGAAIGVRADRWPQQGGAPMRHLLTIDLAELPSLRERCPDGSRAIAVFAPTRGRAAGRSLRRGAVLALTADDLATGEVASNIDPRDRAMRVRVARIDAPSWINDAPASWPIGVELRPAARALLALFERAEGRTLRLAHDGRARAGAEEDATFLFEFDDRLIDVALPERTTLRVHRDALLVLGPADDDHDAHD